MGWEKGRGKGEGRGEGWGGREGSGTPRKNPGCGLEITVT